LFKKTDTTSGCSALIKKDKPLAEISTVSWNGSYNETSDKKEATEKNRVKKRFVSLLLMNDH